jgi:amidase
MSKELLLASARDLANGLQTGRWTSVELTEHFLGRIAKYDTQVQSVPIVFRKEALAQATASDLRRSKNGSLGPLDGLPMTVKDAIRIKGLRSTYGLLPFRNYTPKTDSKLAEAMRKSGIVFLGRTAVPTGAFDWNCRNQVYPECLNPFDLKRTPGGSSGGAAAALAMRMTPIELGSDLGGSIRYPAHCCGVYGLRTTDGLLPVDDVGPEGFGTAFRQMISFGPMAKTREDLNFLLEVFSTHLPLTAGICGSDFGGKLRIAYSNEIMGTPLEDSTRIVFKQYLDQLKAQGHDLIEIAPPLDFEVLYQNWGIIAGYEYTNTIPRLIRNRLIKSFAAWWLLDRRIGKGPFTDHFKRGILASKKEYEEACERRNEIYQTLTTFFLHCSVWILPTAPSPAIPLCLSGKEIKTVYGLFSYSQYVGSYTVPTTALGTPVLSLPIGADESGMPIGVQVFGPRFSDRWLVDIAAALESDAKMPEVDRASSAI